MQVGFSKRKTRLQQTVIPSRGVVVDDIRITRLIDTRCVRTIEEGGKKIRGRVQLPQFRIENSFARLLIACIDSLTAAATIDPSQRSAISNGRVHPNTGRELPVFIKYATNADALSLITPDLDSLFMDYCAITRATLLQLNPIGSANVSTPLT